MQSFSDIELWALVKQDDATAFEALYNRHWEKCYTISYWHILEQESAKDLVQELFVDLWDKRKQINIQETVEGYLKIAVRNRIYNYIRSLNIKKKHYDALGQDARETGFSTEDLNNERELRRLYMDEIGKLPPKMKEIYTLSKEKGMSITQIAERLSLSEQTIKNQLGNALKKIRSGLEHYRLVALFLVIFSLCCFLNGYST